MNSFAKVLAGLVSALFILLAFKAGVMLQLILAYLLWLKLTDPGPNYPAMPPFRLPALGHLPYFLFCKKRGTEAMEELYEKFSRNGLLALHFGWSTKVVVMGTLDKIKECNKMEETHYRMADQKVIDHYKWIRNTTKGVVGIAMNDGKRQSEGKENLFKYLICGEIFLIRGCMERAKKIHPSDIKGLWAGHHLIAFTRGHSLRGHRFGPPFGRKTR